jgi:phenylacetate-CoA ligase
VSTAQIIYDRSPVWLQNCMVSAQGFLYKHRRWDMELGRALLEGLRHSQWWTAEQFRAYQISRLRKHLQHAEQHIPYYAELFRKAGFNCRQVSSLQDLARIPVLEKRTIIERPNDFLWGGGPQNSWNKLFTSGTTGSPLPLYSSRESFTRTWSFVFRLREWAGLPEPIIPRRAQFTGRDIAPERKITGKGPYWRMNVPGAALLLSTTHISGESVPAYVDAMKRFGPDLVDGYPSAIALIARISKRLNLELPTPRAVITSAETLQPEDRSEIESAFGSPVFDQYASSDAGAFICNCEYGSLHVNPEFGVCEVVKPDGTTAGPGEEGEIVATSFCNKEQVFIRYKIGDLAVPGPPEPCACGRMMPRIAALTGRADDVLYIPDRGFVGRFDPVFKGLEGMYEAQIVHEALDRLAVNVVPAPGYDGSQQAALVASLRKKVGDRISIVVRKVSSIPRGPRGKLRAVVTHCKDQYPSV